MRPSETLSYNVDILSMELRKEDPSTILTQKDHILCKYREKSRHYKIHAPIVEKQFARCQRANFQVRILRESCLNLTLSKGLFKKKYKQTPPIRY